MPPDSARKRSSLPLKALVRYGFVALVMCVVLAGGIYAAQRLEQFLIRDPRFFLAGPADYGQASPNIQLSGVQYASRWRILRAFEQDYRRSLYEMPLTARRRALLNVSWVRDASLVRVWPDRLLVSVTERTPVAFIKLPADGVARWALIDDDGIILEPPQKAPFHLPVLSGVLAGESPDRRARRVRRMQQLLRDLGDLADGVSEVDAADLDDLKISEQVRGRAISLYLGDRNFSSRLKNFLNHYPDIHRKMPQATQFDLRLDDRITALEETSSAR